MPRIVEIKEEDKFHKLSFGGCLVTEGYLVTTIPLEYILNALSREQLYKGGLYFRNRQAASCKNDYKSGELCLEPYYVDVGGRVDAFYNQILSESSKNILSISNSNIIQVSGIPGRIKVHA